MSKLLEDPLISPTLPESEFVIDTDEGAPPLPEDGGNDGDEAEVGAEEPGDADANEEGTEAPEEAAS